MNSLFEVDCPEPGGIVRRKVYKLEFTPDNLTKMWEKQKKYKTLMGRQIDNFEEFVNFFVKPPCEVCSTGGYKARGICYVIDDFVGIFWISDIVYPAYAEVHYTFFDGRHRGREALVVEAIKYSFHNYNINRFYVRVGLYAKLPLQFISRLGFKKEGRLRKCVYYKDEWFDANCYSILREEIDQLWVPAQATNHMITNQKSKQD